jgi:hypothetical protein
MNYPHWSEEEIAYFDAMVADGPLPTHIIVRRMSEHFRREFRRQAVIRRMRAKGFPVVRAYSAGTRQRFIAFLSQHPTLGDYAAARQFNRETGEAVYGQLAHYWRQKGVV